jgi:TPP-dependent trihydroxycyclohexane-1,2-dione (THcHDO) dehydratase
VAIFGNGADTAGQEGLKITVLLVDNYELVEGRWVVGASTGSARIGYGSIAALSETRGSQAFACRFNYRGEDGQFSDQRIEINLAANAASYGADVLTAASAEELKKALADAAGIDNTVVIYVQVDAQGRFGGSGAWWDVPVSEASELESTQSAGRSMTNRSPGKGCTCEALRFSGWRRDDSDVGGEARARVLRHNDQEAKRRYLDELLVSN